MQPLKINEQIINLIIKHALNIGLTNRIYSCNAHKNISVPKKNSSVSSWKKIPDTFWSYFKKSNFISVLFSKNINQLTISFSRKKLWIYYINTQFFSSRTRCWNFRELITSDGSRKAGASPFYSLRRTYFKLEDYIIVHEMHM